MRREAADAVSGAPGARMAQMQAGVLACCSSSTSLRIADTAQAGAGLRSRGCPSRDGGHGRRLACGPRLAWVEETASTVSCGRHSRGRHKCRCLHCEVYVYRVDTPTRHTLAWLTRSIAASTRRLCSFLAHPQHRGGYAGEHQPPPCGAPCVAPGLSRARLSCRRRARLGCASAGQGVCGRTRATECVCVCWGQVKHPGTLLPRHCGLYGVTDLRSGKEVHPPPRADGGPAAVPAGPVSPCPRLCRSPCACLPSVPRPSLPRPSPPAPSHRRGLGGGAGHVLHPSSQC